MSLSNENNVPVAKALPTRIPPDKYDAICYDTELGRSWGGRWDVYIKFRIIEGPYEKTELVMMCTYHPKAEITHRHKYYQQFALANGGPPLKGQKMSHSIFRHKVYRVLVKDTKRKFPNNELLPPFLQYSVVATILEVIAGGPIK